MIILVESNAYDKDISYKVIGSCKNTINNNTGKFDAISTGFILGLATAHSNILKANNIDNDHAGLDISEYAEEMCKIAIRIRKTKNKETGGKYDVTKFIYLLANVGYFMSEPEESDEKKKK